MKDPCVPSLPKGPFIPILTHSFGLKLNSKNKETCIWIGLTFCRRALGQTGSILRRILLYIA